MNSALTTSVCALAFALSGLSYAAPSGKSVAPAIKLQGGSASSVEWRAPVTSSYKVHVFVPNNGAAPNALYRIYPNGKRKDSTECLSSDEKFPCYEVSIDQTQHQNAWTQLTLNDDPETQWAFTKNKGYVSAVASNLAATELLNLSSLIRFENQTIQIGKTYQGGIIFYIDKTGVHGLVAAAKDQSEGIQWHNGFYIDTGATATAVGTGAANTQKIINAQGSGQYAANLVSNLSLNGYDDWFLPSKDELNLMYQAIGPGAIEPITNVGGFASGDYWSSSVYNNHIVWSQSFASGDQFSNYNYIQLLVRAVRAF
ncbi:DUF1566 domain-containing protein [Methylocucumis oryzae]|uniref:Lcl C-terminal domain-containing protein n=1 Tax=Methylocucumis oryzae TaxID=1632867 RepID=A0A0F3ING5_9GAMM|nr:DUF1566 domain-containing protein [Methylocucumis oryzae]KJV08103.1 hypothetical protein VZ94_00310 [Methylocucumis oryzae]